MSGKRTHKLRMLGDVSQIVSRAASVTAAARQLGVNRSTVTRWIAAGAVSRPARARRRKSEPHGAARAGQSPDTWARSVRRDYELSATEAALLDLAVSALTLARDAATPAPVRLAAMGRYQQLVRQLQLEDIGDGEAEGERAEIRPFPRPVG